MIDRHSKNVRADRESKSTLGRIGRLIGKDVTTIEMSKEEIALETRWILAVTVITSLLIGVAFLYVYRELSGDPDNLAAAGQLLGAFFSCLALLGIVAAQVFQYRSLVFQKAGLETQLDSFKAQYESLRATNNSIAIEMVQSAIERSDATLARYTRSLLKMCRAISDDELQTVEDTSIKVGASAYCSHIINSKIVLSAILTDIENGLSASIAEAYVRLFESLCSRSSAICSEMDTIDIFKISFDNSPQLQLYIILKNAMGTRADTSADQVT
jgi:hypothetical protein